MLDFLGRHLREINAGYFQHLRRAIWLALRSVAAASVLTIHAVLPFVFVYSGSTIIKRLYLDTLSDARK